jgi:hypothetical protein
MPARARPRKMASLGPGRSDAAGAFPAGAWPLQPLQGPACARASDAARRVRIDAKRGATAAWAHPGRQGAGSEACVPASLPQAGGRECSTACRRKGGAVCPRPAHLRRLANTLELWPLRALPRAWPGPATAMHGRPVGLALGAGPPADAAACGRLIRRMTWPWPRRGASGQAHAGGFRGPGGLAPGEGLTACVRRVPARSGLAFRAGTSASQGLGSAFLCGFGEARTSSPDCLPFRLPWVSSGCL